MLSYHAKQLFYVEMCAILQMSICLNIFSDNGSASSFLWLLHGLPAGEYRVNVRCD